MIEIKIDPTSLAATADWLTLQGKQTRFAASIALNRTAEEINAQRQVQLQKVFTIREKNLLILAAPTRLPVENRATKDRLQVELVHKDYAHVLDAFETGTPKVAKSRDTPIVIPTKAIQPNSRVRVPRALYPVNLGLVKRRTINPTREGPHYYAQGRGSIKNQKSPRHVTRTGKIQIKGKRGTFMLTPETTPGLAPTAWGVYQRVGKEVRMIWRAVMQVPRPPRLEMEKQAEEGVARRFDANFAGAFEFAMRTAK